MTGVFWIPLIIFDSTGSTDKKYGTDLKSLEGEVKVEVLYSGRCDLDNALTTICDALERSKKISSDRMIYELSIQRIKLRKEENLIFKKIRRKIFISKDINLAERLNLDGVYLPSFYKSLNIRRRFKKKLVEQIPRFL